jgi:hypothetical protein
MIPPLTLHSLISFRMTLSLHCRVWSLEGQNKAKDEQGGYIQPSFWRHDTQHKGLVCDTEQHNNDLHYAECHYAPCRVLFIVMLNVVVLNVIILSVVKPSFQLQANGLV